jgi:creatinine amidohydrolase
LLLESQNQSPGKKGAWVAGLAWPEVESRAAAGAVAVLPVGAACKEHGMHLPLNTDQIQAEWLAGQITTSRNVLIWPTVTYGYYPAFVDFPGSCNLAKQTFSSAICDILQGILRTRVRRILVVNTGISTIEPLQKAISMLEKNDHVILVNVYAGSHFRQAQREVEEQALGRHADEIETSIMLAMAPHLVDMTKSTRCLGYSGAGVLNRTDPGLQNYSPSGVIGDATLASRDKGERLVQAILDDLNELFEQLS